MGVHTKRFQAIREPVGRLLIEGYIELLLSSYLGVIAILRTSSLEGVWTWFTNYSDLACSVSSIVILLLCLFIPFWLKGELDEIYLDKTTSIAENKFAFVWEDYKTRKYSQALFPVL